jgi:hypothetical protein
MFRDPLRRLVPVEAPGLLPVVRAHELEDVLAHDLGLGEAEGLEGGGIGVDHSAPGVGLVDDVLGRLHELAVAGFALAERLLFAQEPLAGRQESLALFVAGPQAAMQGPRPGRRGSGAQAQDRDGQARSHGRWH